MPPPAVTYSPAGRANHYISRVAAQLPKRVPHRIGVSFGLDHVDLVGLSGEDKVSTLARPSGAIAAEDARPMFTLKPPSNVGNDETLLHAPSTGLQQ
jgi:hypothetical protein